MFAFEIERAEKIRFLQLQIFRFAARIGEIISAIYVGRER